MACVSCSRSQHQAVAAQAWIACAPAPEITQRSARLQRAALVHHRRCPLRAQPLEHARIDAARDDTAWQILDRGMPPASEIATAC
jgi:hypothetical protein